MKPFGGNTQFAGLAKDYQEKGGMKAVAATAAAGAQGAPKKLRELKLPTLSRITVSDPRETEKEVNTCDANIGIMRENLADLGRLLDSDRARHLASWIREQLDGMILFVRSYRGEENQRQLRLAYISSMLEMFPPSKQALNLLADVGVALGGTFAEAPEGFDPRQTVRLPLTVVEDGQRRWRGATIRVVLPGSWGLIRKLQKFAEKVEAAEEQTRSTRAGALYEGSENLLEALEQGGEATFFAPDGRSEKGIFLPGGHVRVKIEGGDVFAIAAEGKCFHKVREIAEAGVSIPVEAIASQRLELRERVDQDTFFMMLAFHGILNRGYQLALKNRERELETAALKARATVTAESMVMDSAVGAAFLFFKSWAVVVTTDGKNERKELKNIELLVERNADGAFRVADCPKRFETVFASCREFTKTADVAQPLSAMLNRLHNVFARKREREAATAVSASPQNVWKPTETSPELAAELLGKDEDEEAATS